MIVLLACTNKDDAMTSKLAGNLVAAFIWLASLSRGIVDSNL